MNAHRFSAGLVVVAVCLGGQARAQDPAGPTSVEELLRQLDRSGPPLQDDPLPGERPDPTAPSTIPSLPTFPLFPPSGGSGVSDLFSPPPAVHLYRAADPVEVISEGVRRNLQYWDPHLELQIGDQLRQGPKARTVLDFPDGAAISIDGPAILDLRSELEAPLRWISLPVLKKLALVQLYETRTQLDFPGGTRVRGADTSYSVRVRDLRDLILRNSGPSTLVVENTLFAEGSLRLAGGQEVILPIVQVVGRGPVGDVRTVALPAPEGGSADGAIVPMKVRAPRELAVDDGGEEILVSSSDGQARVAQIAGARVIVAPGDAVRVKRAALGRQRGERWRSPR